MTKAGETNVTPSSFPFTIRSGRATGKVLNPGDWFRTVTDPGSVFHFISFRTNADNGHEYVEAYGGDKDPRGRRSFRSFYPSIKFVPAKAPLRDKA